LRGDFRHASGVKAFPLVICVMFAVGLTAMAEVLSVITSYGIAYSRSPPRMKSLVLAINLFMTAFASAISLATADVIQDPFLTWAFAGPSIAGVVLACLFWFVYKDLDKEDYTVHLWNDGPTAVGSPDESVNGDDFGSKEEKGEKGEKRALGTSTALDI